MKDIKKFILESIKEITVMPNQEGPIDEINLSVDDKDISKDTVKKLIESVLDMLEAKETDDPAIFKLDGKRKERKEDEEDKDKDEDDKDSDKDEDKDKKKDNDKPEEDEDDSSRGDDSDLL